MPRHELFRRWQTAIEIDSAQHRFERIGQRGRPLATAMRGFTATDNQVRPEIKGLAFFRECAAIHEFGAGFRERTFTEIGKFLVELAGKDELQDGVTEKFEPL